MKRLLMIPVALFFIVFTGCSTLGNGTAPTPAQVAASLCTPVQTAVNTINLMVQQNPTNAQMVAVAGALAKIQPILAQACTGALTVTSDSIQALITQGLPALGAIIGVLPLPGAQLANIENDFMIAETAINMVDVVVQNIKASQAAQASLVAPK